jgi:hypothetical protein
LADGDKWVENGLIFTHSLGGSIHVPVIVVIRPLGHAKTSSPGSEPDG